MTARIERKARREWLVDVLVGGAIGVLVGAVVAVNLVILVGPEKGYESSIAEVFEHDLVAGLVTVAILALSPAAGIWLARRRRRWH